MLGNVVDNVGGTVDDEGQLEGFIVGDRVVG